MLVPDLWLLVVHLGVWNYHNCLMGRWCTYKCKLWGYSKMGSRRIALVIGSIADNKWAGTELLVTVIKKIIL